MEINVTLQMTVYRIELKKSRIGGDTLGLVDRFVGENVFQSTIFPDTNISIMPMFSPLSKFPFQCEKKIKKNEVYKVSEVF